MKDFINIEKEFIPYEQALALKKLGFDESCFRQYYNDNNGTGLTNGCVSNPKNSDIKSYYKYRNKHCSAPTYSQAFRWFREKYFLFGQITIAEYELENNGFEYEIKSKDKSIDTWRGGYKTYEEAELECVKMLIKLVTKN